MNASSDLPGGSSPAVSHHAEVRLRQRGLRARDLSLVLANGTRCDEVTILTPEDAERAIAARKQEIAALERLRGVAVIEGTDAVVTAYRPDRGRTRHVLRRADRRGCDSGWAA